VGEVAKLLAACGPGVGRVAGSRVAAGAMVTARASRKFAGAIFRGVLGVLGLNLLRDTQCGFKLYRADLAGQIVKHAKEDGFAFDLEHLLIVKAAALRVEEVGVRWEHKDGGTVRPIADGMRMVRQAARIRARWLGGGSGVERLPRTMPPRERVLVEVKSAAGAGAAL
jgi:hypothetical protein